MQNKLNVFQQILRLQPHTSCSRKERYTPLIWSVIFLLNTNIRKRLLRVCRDSNVMRQNVFASNSEMLTQILSSSCLLNWLHSSSMCFALFSPSPRVSLFVCLLARLSVSVSTDLTGPHSKSPLSDDSPLFYRLCNPPPLTAWAFIGLSIVVENQITLSWWLKNINRQFIEVSTLRWTKLSQLAPKCASSYQKLYGYVFLQDLCWLDTTDLRSLIGKVHRVFK